MNFPLVSAHPDRRPTRWTGPLTAILALAVVGWPASLRADATLWNFDNADDRFAATSGPGVFTYFDPDGTGWGPAGTSWGKASSFGLPPMTGGDPDVLVFPGCTGRQGYWIAHASPANGPYGESAGKVSNYTLILDVLFPSASDGRWRALYQTDVNNTNDAEFYVQNAPSGGVGIMSVYHGSIRPDTWHRIVIVMQAAPGEGKCQRFIDGRFVGGIGSTGSALDSRWALGPEFLLLSDDDGETATGVLASVAFVDRAMRMEEIQALGGPHAGGALTPGAPAPPLTQQMPRRVGVIGHRGGFFCCAPDNTLAAVRRALSNHVPVIEIDTRLSADGVCILLHDSTVDRTTDGTGAAATMSVAQLKSLDAGSWFSPEFAGEQIPTVAEVMAEVKGRMILYFDLKTPGQIDAIVDALTQTGFNPDDCWFWNYSNVSDAAAIRARLPNAKIIWADPPSNWASDPNFFPSMRSIGVWGFDLGVYYGTVNPAFTRAAKAEGFMVSIYTILDPDTMVRNAAAGVDYMETDFPRIMNQIQPPQFDAASHPTPAHEAANVLPNPMLTWVVASNATAHRIYFGPSTPPPFFREQTHDLVPLTNLTLGATYFWRIDEVTASAVVTGAVWSFTVVNETPPTTFVYEWTFDHANLEAALGCGIMEYADGITPGLTTFGTTDGLFIPHIGGEPATYMHVPAFTGIGNGYLLTFTDSGPNGGGAYLNRFTFLADLLIPGSLNWTPLFNSQPANSNDADWYVDSTGRLGIAALGYSAAGTVQANTWHRVAFAADLTAGSVAFYRDGTPVFSRTTTGLLDDRFSLYSNSDLGPDLLLFNEGDTTGVYTHELYAASIAFADRTLSSAEIAALGAPRAEGIFVQRIHIAQEGTDIVLTWAGAPNVRLQRATTLAPANWQDVPDTLGASSFTESTPGTAAFFRLVRQ